MDEHYDFVIFGTGLAECLASWMLASKGKKVLQLDRNKTYGSELRSLRYKDLVAKFGEPELEELSENDRMFSVDLVPKLVLVDGDMCRLLRNLGIFDIIGFTTISGSFVYKNKKLHTIPASILGALKSGLLSIFQRPKVMSFFKGVRDYCKKAEETKFEPKMPGNMRDYYKRYGLDGTSRELIGHAIALNMDDGYLERPPNETLNKIRTYVSSLLMQGDSAKSPYVYPMYGVSELSQAFSRRAASCGAVYRINTPVLAIKDAGDHLVVDIEDNLESSVGKIIQIHTDNVLGDPTYFPDKVKLVNRVVECICIVKGDVGILKGVPSAQVLFLASEFNRKNDIFLLVLGDAQHSTPRGYKSAIVSTVAETDAPYDEVAPIIGMLGDVKQRFTFIRDIYEAAGAYKNIFISRTVDQSTHFQSLYGDIVRLASEIGTEDVLKKYNELEDVYRI